MPEAEEASISDEARQQLAKVFAMVDQWRLRTHAEPRRAQPGSSLWKDDTVTAPYQLSHMATGALVSAVDHLDAFRALVVDAGVLHARAPFTLLRAALENAATAVWLLAPASRNERVLRRLRLQWADSRDGENAQRLFGIAPRLSKAEWKAKLEGIAAARGLSPEQVAEVTGRAPTFKSIVETAGNEAQELKGRDVLFLWMLASGMAHARNSAVYSSLLNQIETGASVDDVVTVSLTASDRGVTLVAMFAALMMFEGWRLLDERSQSHMR